MIGHRRGQNGKASIIGNTSSHVAWDDLVIHADDPWWHTHYPPNGWGCRCYVQACDEIDLRELGKDGPDEPPPSETRKVKYGDREIEVPAGIDPGWAYAPGRDVSGTGSQPSPDAPKPSKPLAASPAEAPKRVAPPAKPQEPKPPAPEPEPGRLDSQAPNAIATADGTTQAQMRRVAQAPPELASRVYETLGPVFAKLEQPWFNEWASALLPLPGEKDDTHKARVKRLPEYNQARVIGVVHPSILHWIKANNKKFPSSAAIEIMGRDVMHVMRPSKSIRGAGIHKDDMFRLLSLLASPDEVYWDNREGNLVYVFHPSPKTLVKIDDKLVQIQSDPMLLKKKRGKIAIRIDIKQDVFENGVWTNRKLNKIATAGIVFDDNLSAYTKIL